MNREREPNRPISRRRLLAMSVVGALVPRGVEAQPAGKVWRIGYLSLQRVGVDKSWVGAFREGLRELGYVEGRNIVIEERHAAGRPERLRELAAELVRLNVDVLVVYGAWHAADQLRAVAIPVVFTVHPDPVGMGLIASLARPGGNLTGLSDTHAELVPKRLELLRQIAPATTRVGVLLYPNRMSLHQLKTAQAAAPAQGMTLLPVEVKGPEPADIEPAFATLRKERPGALIVIPEPTLAAHRGRISEFALKNRLPAIGTVRDWAVAGFLMSYGTNFHDLWRRAAAYVDKILKGAKPGDLPVEQPTRFELVINMKTAKALGLRIPESVVIRADEVIQ